MDHLEYADRSIFGARRLAVRIIGEAVKWLERAGLVVLLALAVPLLAVAILIGWIFGDE